MDLRQAAQAALEALENCWGRNSRREEAIANLRAALAEQPEPVAWQWLDTANFRKAIPASSNPSEWRPLFTHPPRKPVRLTEDDIVRCLVEAGCLGKVKMSYESGPYDITRTSINADRFARAVEAAVLKANNLGVSDE